MKKIGHTFAIIISFVIICIIALAGFFIFRYISKLNNKPINQPQVIPNQLFFSDFNNSKDLKFFNIVDAKNAQNSPSKWEISNNSLIQKSSIFKDNPLNPGSIILIKNSNDWTDTEASMKFTPNNDGVFGIILKYNNENNFYKISMTCNSNLNGPFTKIEKIQNGNFNILYQNKLCYNLKKENLLKIVNNNNRIDIYLNSTNISLYGIDKNNPLKNGSFGFLVSNMPDLSINNLEIKKLTGLSASSGQVLSNKTKEEKLDSEINNLIEELGL